MQTSSELHGNQIALCGYPTSAPTFSHENHGRRFYRFLLDCPRLSGTLDTLPVLASRELLQGLFFGSGPLTVIGQIRSFNAHTESGRHLILSVYAEDLFFGGTEPRNEVSLVGTLCKPPILRRTPLGRQICDAMLRVSRPYGRGDYLPCIFWGRTAEEIAGLPQNAPIALQGRMQSRLYRKLLEDGTSEERTAYEISALSASPLP